MPVSESGWIGAFFQACLKATPRENAIFLHIL